MLFTARDEDIVKTLVLKVRMLSLDQLAEGWWQPTATGKANARRRLAMFARTGMVRRAHVQARPLPEMSSPIAVWKPGQAGPDFAAIAWRLQSRWQKPPRRTTVYVATQKAANQFGGRLRGLIKHDLQATHDLGVAQIYLQMLRTNPKDAEQWIGEDVLRLARPRQKIPDAIIAAGPDRSTRVVIEFGGAYDSSRVRHFHRDCAQRKLPYEIW
jgi:hypothetical protein